MSVTKKTNRTGMNFNRTSKKSESAMNPPESSHACFFAEEKKLFQLWLPKYSAALTGIFLLLAYLNPVQLAAQVPAAIQNEPVALTGATIHTVSDGVIENGTILFEGGTITAIGTDIEIPSNTVVRDVTGRHVYPGFIDAYSEMGIYEIGAVDMTLDINEQGSINPNVRPEAAFNPESRHIGIARSSGVLVTVTTPDGGLISGKSTAMMLDGWTWETMVVKSGTGLIVNWPSPLNEDDYEEGLQILRDYFADARTYRKAYRAVESGDIPRLDFDIRLNSMIPVLEGDIPVVVNANDLRQIQDAVTWAEEEEVEIVILGGRDAPYVANHLASRNIPVIVTTVLASPGRAWEPYDNRYSLPAKLQQAGIRFAIAGASSAPYTNRLPYEAGAAAAYGLDPDLALHSITLAPAEILGFNDRLGSLEPGKDATLIITTGNPLEYSTQIEQAYIEGREIDMNDMHRQFYERYQEKVRQAGAGR
jgi:imidazolonepropionase-like amidohydrolase